MLAKKCKRPSSDNKKKQYIEIEKHDIYFPFILWYNMIILISKGNNWLAK